MTTTDRAAEIIADVFRPLMKGHANAMGRDLATKLAAAGLLAPESQIIRTREELAALDPDTLVTSRIPVHDAWPGCQVVAFPAPAAHRLDLTWCGPMAVIATGEQIRAARQALKEV